MPAQMSLALAARDVGMARAERGAGSDWQRLALGYLREYVALDGAPFMAEDFRVFAEAHGLAPPANSKAYGPLMMQAARLGIVRACGYAPAASSNGSPKVRWESV